MILILAGVICLLISGYMMYRMMPRRGQDPAPIRSESGETALALGQFTLLIAGLTLLAKGIF